MKTYFNGVTRLPSYDISPDVEVFELNGYKIIVDPSYGGWCVGTELDIIRIFSKLGIDFETAEKLFNSNIISRNGSRVFEKNTYDLASGQLYYYEINLTDACNLKCSYCSGESVSPQHGKFLEESTARKWLDRIIEHSLKKNIKYIILEFTGGEPLLNIPVLKYLLEYAEKLRKKYNLCFNYQIQTNLSIPLSDEVIKLLVDLNVSIGTSIDGPKELHNKARPARNKNGNGLSITLDNIKRIRNTGHRLEGVLTTISSETVDHIQEIGEFLIDNGFTQLAFTPLRPAGRAKNFNDLVPDPRKHAREIYKFFINYTVPIYKKTGKMITERYMNTALANLLQPYRLYMCAREVCGATTNICATTVDGDVYPCNEHWSDDYLLGNIWDKSFEEMMNSVPAKILKGRRIKNIEECKICNIRAFCQSPCPNGAILKYGELNKPSIDCDFWKELYTSIILGLIEGEIDLEVAQEQVKRLTLKSAKTL